MTESGDWPYWEWQAALYGWTVPLGPVILDTFDALLTKLSRPTVIRLLIPPRDVLLPTFNPNSSSGMTLCSYNLLCNLFNFNPSIVTFLRQVLKISPDRTKGSISEFFERCVPISIDIQATYINRKWKKKTCLFTG